ncbi:hypothetical protein NQZ68_032588 [Dissostichus eleginoides]|nr:hypothetical protein NQZ68_032588 [Dissostichus eleginoides]
MDQMADEMTLRAEVKDKGRANAAEESSTWARGERIQSEARGSDWRLGATANTEPGETRRNSDTQRPRECDRSSSPIFSLKMYLRRTSSTGTLSSPPSSQQSNMGVDCAGIILDCLFCRLYNMVLMLPDPCERLVNQCCPNYKQVITTLESTADDNDSQIDLDCGLCGCHDAGDCIELAMEMSEICYH